MKAIFGDILRNFNIFIETVINEQDASAVAEIEKKLEELQKELLKRAKSKEDYSDIADEIDHLREQKQNAMAENAEREGLKQRIAEMQEFLAEQMEQIEEDDESLVRRMVEKVTVYEKKFSVEFKSGTSVDVER
jgi:predicted  nucleic acid-binding Zn-ribbon protein